jgi:PAS domain-containing protein
MLPDFALVAIVAGTSVLSALVSLWLASLLQGAETGHGARKLLESASAAEPEPAILVFEGRDLIDATGPAQAMLNDSPPAETDWDRFIAAMSPHFPGLEEQLASLSEEGKADLRANRPDGLRIIARDTGRTVRIEILDPSAEGVGVMVDGLSHRAAAAERTLLRSALANVPVLVWRLGEDGSVDWANRAYLRRAAEHIGLSEGDLTWPLPVLFDPRQIAAGGAVRRQRVVSPDTTKGQWYECRTAQTDEGLLHFAVPIDATIRAETALREFVQTLTKTFAQLPIGLAIFDRQRQLALFNPALIDLTRLNAEMLSARPTLFAFLDNLREARMIPEPKDYPTWRQTMTELEKAAASGLYEETWTLPSGQTYRVTGRPHPDGAVAFLFEDITAEISLTRRFRSEIETGQAVIDKLEDAIAVFSQAGTIVLSNAGYAALWGIDPQSTLGAVSIADAMRSWQKLSVEPSDWDEARHFVTDIAPRGDLIAEADLIDGTRVAFRLSRLSGGGTLARFRRADKGAPLQKRRLRLRPVVLRDGSGIRPEPSPKDAAKMPAVDDQTGSASVLVPSRQLEATLAAQDTAESQTQSIQAQSGFDRLLLRTADEDARGSPTPPRPSPPASPA